MPSPRYLLVAAAVLGVLALGVAYGVAERTAARRAERIEQLQADTARLHAEMRQVQAAVRTQNDSLRALRRHAARLDSLARVAHSAAVGLRQAAERRAGRIERAPIPPGCTAAIRWGIATADTLSTRWH